MGVKPFPIGNAVAELHSLIPPLIPPLRGGIVGMGVKPFPIGNAVASLHSLSGVKPFPIGNAVASLQKKQFF